MPTVRYFEEKIFLIVFGVSLIIADTASAITSVSLCQKYDRDENSFSKIDSQGC